MRFRGSCFGWGWSFLLPLFMLVVYTVIFGNFFKSRWGVDIGENKMVFAVALFSGITFYNIFSESVSASTSAVIGNVNYVKKVCFPLEFLPLSQVASTALLSLPSIILLFLSIIIIFKHASICWLLLPLTMIPLVFFTAGVALFVSSLGVFFRDIQYLIGVVLQMLFFLSPVFYNLENLPPQFQKKLLFNPMVWFIEANRKILFVDCMPGYNSLPSVTEWAGIYIFGTVAFLLGYIWFFKTKRGFSDVL